MIDIGDDGVAEFTADRTAFTRSRSRATAATTASSVVNAGGPSTTPITLDGGNGNDDLRGGAGAETLIGGSGDDFADGNLGTDTAKLGSGNDRFQWDPGDGSDTVEGESGTDALDFNGSNVGEQIDVTANGDARAPDPQRRRRSPWTSPASRRVACARSAAPTTSRSATSRGTGLRVADVDLRAFDGDGDAAADTVTARGTDGADRFNVGDAAGKLLLDGPGADVQVTAAEAQDHARVAALGEADTITSDSRVPGPGQVDIDGGDGADRATTKRHRRRRRDRHRPQRHRRRRDVRHRLRRGQPRRGRVPHRAGPRGRGPLAGINGIGALTALTLDGGEGDDDLRGADGADTLLGGNGDDHVDGNLGADTALLGAGDDRFQWDPGDGSDTVEGQSGADALDFNGSNAGEQIDVTAQRRPRAR